MVRRYFTRTGKSKSAQTLQDELLADVRRQAETLLNQLTRQFTSELQSLQREAARSSGGGSSETISSGSANTDDDFSLSSSNTQLLSNGLRYLVSKPKFSTSSRESARSIDADSQFRLAQAQALSEASASLSAAEKNR